MNFVRVSFLFSLCFFTACGTAAGKTDEQKSSVLDPVKKEGPSKSQNPTSFMVANLASLPTCNTSIKNSLAFLKEEKQFYGCDGTAWALVEVKGDKGDAGAKGDSGTTSNQGISSLISCDGDMATVSSQNRTLNGLTVPSWPVIQYSAAIFNNGDTLATASVRGASYEISKSSFYSRNQVGASTAPVQLVYDVISPNDAAFWTVSVNRITGVATVQYYDADFNQAPNYLQWNFLASACTIQNY